MQSLSTLVSKWRNDENGSGRLLFWDEIVVLALSAVETFVSRVLVVVHFVSRMVSSDPKHIQPLLTRLTNLAERFFDDIGGWASPMIEGPKSSTWNLTSHQASYHTTAM